MKKFVSYIIVLCFIYMFISCSKVRKTEAEKEREEWIAGFTDSIDYYQKIVSETEIKLQDINSRINKDLENFEFVENPREVSGYYILKGWKNNLPFTTTSLYARINKDEKLELIATLAGATFNKIGVISGEEEVFSEIVHHDQAFNYRHERFNTVYFSGAKADTIAQFISRHRNDKIHLEYIEGAKKSKATLSEKQKDMISETWNLFECQLQARELQKEFWISSKKIETFRRIMDMQNMEVNKNNE